MKLKIAVVIGSTRPGRLGEAVARWVHEQAANRPEADYELVDLAEFGLTLLDEPTIPGAAAKQYENPQTRAWSKVIDSYDGYVFVTPEYNHGVPAALKNAFDVLGAEWSDKALGLVGYGAAGGVRAVEQWRVIAANLRLMAVRDQVALSLFSDFGPEGFAPDPRHATDLAGMLDQLEQLARILHTVRTGE